MPREGAPGTAVEVSTTTTSYTVDHSEDIPLVVKVVESLLLTHKRNTAMNQCTTELIILFTSMESGSGLSLLIASLQCVTTAALHYCRKHTHLSFFNSHFIS